MESSSVNLTNSKELIGEFLFDYNITNSHYNNMLNRHIIRAIELMDIDTYFVRCIKKEIIEDGVALLPCNSKYIEVALFNTRNGYIPIDIENSNWNIIRELKNVQSTQPLQGYAEGAYLKTIAEKGEVIFIYRSLPKDKEGYILIPDDAWLKEAILNFLIAKMALSGFKHPVIKREEAEAKWEKLYPRARNSVTFPTVSEIQRYTEMTTNPLKGDLYNNLFNG